MTAEEKINNFVGDRHGEGEPEISKLAAKAAIEFIKLARTKGLNEIDVFPGYDSGVMVGLYPECFEPGSTMYFMFGSDGIVLLETTIAIDEMEISLGTAGKIVDLLTKEIANAT